jgi:hypothetical protein
MKIKHTPYTTYPFCIKFNLDKKLFMLVRFVPVITYPGLN